MIIPTPLPYLSLILILVLNYIYIYIYFFFFWLLVCFVILLLLLKAGPDILGRWVRYISLIDMVVTCCGGIAFYSLMIRSQVFSEPMHLGCEI